MDPNNIQRHQYNTNPDSSYGAVFQLDTLVDVIPGLIYPAWLEVCAVRLSWHRSRSGTRGVRDCSHPLVCCMENGGIIPTSHISPCCRYCVPYSSALGI